MAEPHAPITTTRPAVPLPVLVLAGGVITAVTLGARSTFGLFLDPVIASVGTGRATFALAIAIQNLAWGLCQPVAGAVADRFGTARVLAAGSLLYAVGLLAMASSHTAAGLYLSIGLVVGVGTGAASFAVVLAAIGRMAPPAQRSMALGVASAMGSIGQFVLIPLLQRLIDGGSWERAAVILAAIVASAVVCTPALRGRSADQARAAAGSEPPAPTVALRDELRRAAHSRSYRLLNLGFFVCGFHVTFVGTHLASYAEDVGQTRAVAAGALALIGLFNVAGSLAAGVLGGRYAKCKLLSIIYCSRAVVFALLMVLPPSRSTFVLFGAAMGLLWLSTVPLTSGVVAGQFGTAHVGTLFGIVFLSHQVGAFVGAFLGGSLADRVGSYNPVWWLGAGLGLMAAVLHLLIDEGPQPPPPARVRLAPGPALGTAVVAAVALGSAGLAVAGPRAEATDHRTAPVIFCPLHPAGPG